MTGLWWPLDDCSPENGCLWVVKGSHTRGVSRRFQRTACGRGTEFVPAAAEAFDLAGATPLATPAGALVLLHSAVVHYSERNDSRLPRIAYSIHVLEGGERAGVRFTYPPANWLQRAGGAPFPPLDPVM